MSARVTHPHVVVAGGSIAGLGTAIALDNRGVSVELHEADDVELGPLHAVTEEDKRTPRRATPQAAHSHAFIARSYHLLRDEAPEVLATLLRAGVEPIDLAAARPDTVPLHAHHPDEEDLVVLPARRTTFEAALRAEVARRPAITVRTGHRVRQVLVDDTGSVPRVGGVAFDDGTGAGGDVVVDATGRRGSLTSWLEQRGIAFDDRELPCGITYFTRFYRLLDPTDRPPLNRGYTGGASYDRYSCLVFPADDHTFSITFGTLPEDHELRNLRNARAFDAAAASLELIAPWVDPVRAEPISDVRMMAGLTNRIRRPWIDGRPTVLGWTAVGDAAATTNPAHSRGCTLSLLHAVGVAQAIAGSSDHHELAARFEHVRTTEQQPWFDDSVDQDHHRLSRWRADAGITAPTTPDRLSNGEAYVASHHDAYVWRRFTRLQQLLEKPDDVLGDRRVIARVRAVQASGRGLAGSAAPTRPELVDLLDRASA